MTTPTPTKTVSELKADVYDLLEARGNLLLQAQQIEMQINELKQTIDSSLGMSADGSE